MIDDKYVESMMQQAARAAEKAYDECVPRPMAFQNSNTLTGGFDWEKPYYIEEDGECGGAYIKVVGMRNKIAKHCKKLGYIDGDYGTGYTLNLEYKRFGQSADRAKAAMEAASDVLKAFGLPNYVQTYLT